MTSSNLLILLLLLFVTHSHSQSCKSSCGVFPIHYPFGTGPGCGSPAFHRHVVCDEGNNLMFNTHTGSYPVQSIDYTNQVLYIQDPSISTCTTTNPSSGFSLDWDAPFTFRDGDIFALLDCPPSLSSPSSSNSTMCDATNAPICNLLYSCPAISRLDAPVSTCCIYSPVSLGPSYEMDLKKLQCSSYSAIYSFNGAESSPQGWKFGIALKYRFSVDDGYPSACADCEKTNGVCGYSTDQSNSFTCNCGNGVNTTTNCYYARWNVDNYGGQTLPPLSIGFKLIFSWWVMAWISCCSVQ